MADITIVNNDLVYKVVVPQIGWFMRENPINMDDLEVYLHLWKPPYKVVPHG